MKKFFREFEKKIDIHCNNCDYDEATGDVINHCSKCCKKITRDMYTLYYKWLKEKV